MLKAATELGTDINFGQNGRVHDALGSVLAAKK
jgi:hypothetical protein